MKVGHVVVVLMALACFGACRDGPEAGPPGSDRVQEAQPTFVSVHHVDTAGLPRLRQSGASGLLPARIPRIDAHLPDLLDDLPGRAALVVNPSITVLNTAVGSWSELELLVYGVDGRWRRLNLGDLGLSESLRIWDTYGAGSLSSDGRWWTGSTHDGSVLVDMQTGAVRLLSTERGDWIPGRRAVLLRGAEVAFPSGSRTSVPYDYFSVGYEPDGTPLSLARRANGSAVLVEWHGRTALPRTEVGGLRPPPETIGTRRSQGRVDYRRFGQVMASSGMVAQTQGRGRHRLTIAAADSSTGEYIGRITWRESDFSLFWDDWWLDDETLLIATSPYFLAWRPRTGEVFRATDARSVRDAYWQPSYAPLAR